MKSIEMKKTFYYKYRIENPCLLMKIDKNKPKQVNFIQ